MFFKWAIDGDFPPSGPRITDGDGTGKKSPRGRGQGRGILLLAGTGMGISPRWGATLLTSLKTI
jgi:hypothetical protein